MAGGLDVVLTCWPTRPSKRVVMDRADVGDQSPQGNGGGWRRSGGEALVPVVQAAYLGSRHDLAHVRRVSLSQVGRVLPQRQMRPRPVVVGEIGFQNPSEMALTEDDDVVETFPPYGSHKSFSIWILPRRPRCREDLLDAEALNATAELVAENAVAVADHEPRRRVLGESLDDLLGGPGRTGVLGDVEVKNAAAVVGQNEEDIQNAKRRRGNREEIDRRQRADMVVEEGPPGLRVRRPWLGRHEAGHASLADIDAELQQFAVNSGRAPAHVGIGHLADKPFGLLGDSAVGRAAGARLPSPEQAEAGAVPADHGVSLDDNQHVRPARPEAGEDHPERAVAVAQARAAQRTTQIGQLLAESQVLNGQVRAATEAGSQRSNYAQD